MGFSRRCVPALPGGKSDQHEIADAGQDGQPELLDLFGEPGQPDIVVGARPVDMADVVERRQRRGPGPRR